MNWARSIISTLILYSICNISYGQLKKLESQLDRVDSMLVTKKNESAVLPGPVYNPSLGAGIAILPISVYHLKGQSADTKPSSTQGILFASLNRSYAIGVKQSIFLNSNKYWLEGTLNYASLRLEYYGIGQHLSINEPAWVRMYGITTDLSLQTKINGKLYGGITFNFKSLELNGEEESTNNWLEADGFSTKRENIVMSGLKLSYDSRNHLFTPTSGLLSSMFYSNSNNLIGSELNYVLFGFTCSNYININKSNPNTLAWQLYFRGSSGEVPLYDYSTPGKSKVLRGYISGKHLDKSILTIQSEYRFNIYKNWGAVVFAGAGKVFPDIAEFDKKSWLPSIGTGIRYRLLKTQNVNARLDLAFGKSDFNVYFGISEVF
ncbi:BamA/TamA family outer membrane protein [Carboxylicivirga sp. RSCT41]|uniref:BamA/TamA family outer membrane protein n=1 Tax=Carboxylicivirga agarovorans TaxID=3417570 RepID=UPI003D3568A0